MQKQGTSTLDVIPRRSPSMNIIPRRSPFLKGHNIYTRSPGGQKISFEYCIYMKQKNLAANSVVSFECDKSRQSGSHKWERIEKIKVLGQELGRTNEHNHWPEQSTTKVQKLMAAIRDRAAMTEDPQQRIIADTLSLVTCTQGLYYVHIYSYV